jgi:Fe-S-cluster-containing dehydrogenase component
MVQTSPESNGRRKFLRISLTVLGTAAAGGVARKLLAQLQHGTASSQPNAAATGSGGCSACSTNVSEIHRPKTVSTNPRVGAAGRKWIMVLDLAKCDGCGKCTEACNKMHFIPPDRQYLKVLKMQASQRTAPYYFPQPCYQCDNPPCTKVCPVDATFKREDGPVLVDNERCIGCRFCIAACPYGARSFNWFQPEKAGEEPSEAREYAYSPEHGYPRRIGTVEKCDFCPDMANEGNLPACAASCPMGVIYYGDENEDSVTNGMGQTVRLSQFLRDNAAYRHLEELGTEPRVYYLPPKDRMYPAPGEEEKS